MKLSDKGRKLLERREGLRLNAYRDTVGIWTIGYGHTSSAGLPKVWKGQTITAEQASSIFSRDLSKYETAVNSVINSATQDQYDAMVSLCYNIGTGGFTKSTVVRQHNLSNFEKAAKAFLLWNKPAEIVGRRTGESKQYKGEI